MDSTQLAAAANADGVFRLAARDWTGSLSLDADEGYGLQFVDGIAQASNTARPGSTSLAGNSSATSEVSLVAPAETWERLLSAVPPAQCSDLTSARNNGLKVVGDDETFSQYYGAAARVVELLRIARHGEAASSGPHPIAASGRYDAPVGRYLHVELGGDDHRLYVETAGSGVPLLLQHTAGAHGAQWRHLFENSWLTDHFQLIAYDLPFHGKSLPPSGRQWWADDYRLTTEALMAVPLAVADAMQLVDPVFMGCSIGGLLALDLARFHPDRFKAVIGVEPALKVDGKYEDMQHLWHPRIGSGYKAAMMEGLMAPGSPEALRKETAFVYAQGWPPAFLGDVYFYVVDHDLREEAANIDTGQVEVHLLSGEYDWSATPEAGRKAHEAIPGSTWTFMEGLGHFPMSENPTQFLSYLRPVLEGLVS
ncbi:MAG: pimeloyl-ACP methyl ester carboxylesterase [Acidimicrobiales bacterium]|jgi:pimeloyl-ACP methyl ester carboxylesterase